MSLRDFILARINSAREAKSDILDLRKYRLSSIPKEVFDLSNLRVLDLSSDNIVNDTNIYLNEEYWWEVSFDNNTICSIDEGIARLQNLEELYIAQNDLSHFPSSVCSLKQLRVLDFRNNYINSLPMQISELQHLEVLDLSYNMLKELPPEIGELKSLKVLLLRSNGLTSIPKEIGKLKNLEILDLGNYNPYQMDPETVDKFDLRMNAITCLPDEIIHLHNLKELDLMSNALTELPEQIGELQNLQSLAIGNHKPPSYASRNTKSHYPANRISFLPESIYSIEGLDLSDFY